MKKYIRNEDTVAGRLDDEIVMMDINKGKYFSLNPVASDIWNYLKRPLTVNEICEKLLDQYEVSITRCKSETESHIKDMVRLGLIKEV